MVTAEGDRYSGEVDVNGDPVGDGLIKTKDGRNLYCRNYVAGRCESLGFVDNTASQNRESLFAGSYAGGNLNGFGVELLQNGDVYFGDYVDGALTGTAWFKLNSGIYQISVKDGSSPLPSGCGSGLPASGNFFEGCLENGVKNGNGTMLFKNGEKYVGQFKNDLIDGYGIYFYSNGKRYEGNWRKSVKEGSGVLYSSNGRVEFRDNWMNGRPLR